jgi:hypothetical protein
VTREKRILIALLLTAFAGTGIPAIASGADSASHRGSWLFGLGLGFGVSSVDAPVLTEEGAGLMTTAHLAFPLGDRFKVGFEATAWAASSLNLSASTISAWYFPAEQGFSIRAGAGFGYIEQGKSSPTTTHQGPGFIGGARYEFPTSRSVTVGPELIYTYVTTKDIDANYLGIVVTITWRSPGR